MNPHRRRGAILALSLLVLFVLAVTRPSRRIPTPAPTLAAPPAVRLHGGALPSSPSLPSVPSLPSADPATEPDFAAFHDSLREFLAARAHPQHPPAPTFTLRDLARRRLADLEDLIESNPRRALELALPDEVLDTLPPDLAGLVEHRVGGRGDLEVLCAIPLPGEPASVAPVQRRVLLDGQRYQAFVYGRRAHQGTVRDVSLHGIAVGNRLALAEKPVRGLGPAALRALLTRTPTTSCPVGDPHTAATPHALALAAYGSPTVVCSPSHAQSCEDSLVDLETAQEPVHAPSAASAPTATPNLRRVLFIRVDFSDLIGESMSTTRAAELTRDLHRFFIESSFGHAGFALLGEGSAVTPVYRLPRTASSYGLNDDADDLRTDARNAARADGYVMSNYDLDVVCMGNVPGFGWAGLGFVSGRGAWIRNTTSTGVTAHEIGHNLGLNHANFWDTGGSSTTGPGDSIEYGDKFDTMGAANAGNYHFNARYKRYLGWLQPGEFTVVTTNGLYRLHAHDQTNVVAGSRGLQIFSNARTNAWLEFRRRFTSNKWLMNGVGIRWTGRDNEPSRLLDTTPGSVREKDDSPIVVGRTYSDPVGRFHVTPVALDPTSPASIDVVIQRGAFPDNRPPVLSLVASETSGSTVTLFQFEAAAADPDGDPLAYHWELGDESLGTNAPAIAHAWSANGDYLVQCTVSDMRGGLARASIPVRVGTGSNLFRVSGRVLADGEPVLGALVSAGAGRLALTDSDGSFVIPGLSSGTYTLTARKDALPFTPVGFSNPIRVASDVADLVFSSSDSPLSRKLTLVPAGAQWRYWDAGTLPGPDWHSPAFDDAPWGLGSAILGYGGDRETTVVGFGPSSSQKYITTWFRRAFVVGAPDQLSNVTLGLLRDDGAVVHLNGSQLLRDNMPSGTITPTTRASSAVGGSDESTYWEHAVPVSRLRPGTNWLAVEIHQSGPTSSDIAFDLRLTADQALDAEAGVRLVRPAPDESFRSPARVVLSASIGNSASPLDHVDFLADGRLVGRVQRAPFVVTWNDAPAGPHVLVARASFQDGSTTDSPPVSISVTDAALTSTLIRRGSRWRYLDTGVAPMATWTRADFDDGDWLEGPARLGYGEDGEFTVLGFGPNPSAKHLATWFRHAFEVVDPGSITNLICRLQRDDGAAVFLNGTELYRFGLSATAVLSPTLTALSDIRDDAEQTFYERSIPPAGLVAGRNVIAVELHQVSRANADLGFDFELVAQRALAAGAAPTLTWEATPDGLLLRWPTRFRDWHLESSPVLGPAAAWRRLAVPVATVGDALQATAPADPGFYRLAP